MGRSMPMDPGCPRLRISLWAAALAGACLMVPAQAGAAGSESEGGAAKPTAPTATSQQASEEGRPAAGPNVKINSKSPYAAWRAQREQAQKPDTSGHGHRAPHPAGQTRSRRLAQ